jgi:hypothetical protein
MNKPLVAEPAEFRYNGDIRPALDILRGINARKPLLRTLHACQPQYISFCIMYCFMIV